MFSEFKIKKISKDKELVIGRLKNTKKRRLQSIIKKRKNS